MKKVLLNFAEGLLSREQMRTVKGGNDGYDSGGSCKNSSCKLFVQNDNGSYSEYSGECAEDRDTAMNTITCFCNTTYGGGAPPLSSNGGVSRCNN